MLGRFLLVCVGLLATVDFAAASTDFTPVPEPASLALLSAGIGTMWAANKLRKRKK
jgi:hypothetical protein